MISIKEAIQDLKKGKMLVMVDDEDRENEGDLIFAAQFSSKEKVNFTIKEARGVLCVALNEKLAKHFDLPLMVTNNSSAHETAFTITVDSKEASTGVSAYERDKTIKVFVDENTNAFDFVRPGHINPLIAKKGGVLERTGHTEGSVDLCRLANLKEACVICEIIKDDGEMARRADLIDFCKKWDINMISIADLIEYRLKHDSLIKLISSSDSNICGFKAKKLIFEDHRLINHVVFVFGDIKKRENIKFHTSGSDFDLLTSGKFEELLKQIRFLYENGGILIFMQSETNNKIYMKNYGIGAQILRYFGVEELNLLRDQNRDFVALEGFGLKIL